MEYWENVYIYLYLLLLENEAFYMVFPDPS